MIYLVVYPHKYLAAVINGTPDLVAFLNKVSPEILKELNVEPTLVKEYPFKVLEAEMDGKTYFMAPLSDQEMDNLIKLVNNNPKSKSLAVYTVKENFFGDSSQPGGDFMGMLSHKHLQET